MIVRLTDAQRAVCRVHGTEQHAMWLARGRPNGTTQWDCPMPPIGWSTLLARMTPEAFNDYGQRRGRAPGSMHRAIQRIARSLSTLEAHPALRHQALPGEHDTLLFAWWNDELQQWSVYPREGNPVVLLPEWQTVGGIRVTTWDALPNIGYALRSLSDPAEHLAFSAAHPSS